MRLISKNLSQCVCLEFEPRSAVINCSSITTLKQLFILLLHTNHVDFEPIYKHIENTRCHCISRSFGKKPLFHVIASQFKVAEGWVLSD